MARPGDITKPLPTAAADSPGHRQTVESLNSIRDKYAWILMDAPPLLVVNDASVLASMVDGTMLIVDTGLTRIEALERASITLRDAGGKLLGVVLNRFDSRSAYGAYYGSQRYGHYDNHNSYYRTTSDDNGTT